jgi:1-acyl-sn-glycerol-3-phosphate acyltransferase
LLRSLLFTDPVIILATIVMGTISLITSLFDPTGRAQHCIARAWSRMLLAVSGVKVRVEGAEKLDATKSYVLAANHQSLMDTPVVLACVPLQFRFFAKKGLFRIPFLGTHLRRAGHLPVVREDPRASLKSLSVAAKLVRSRGISVLLFPEGGRAPQGMRDFRDGAAYLAIKAGVPAVPIAMTGTREVLPMGSVHIRRGNVCIRVGDPIPTDGLDLHARKQLTRELQCRVETMLGMNAAQTAREETGIHG